MVCKNYALAKKTPRAHTFKVSEIYKILIIDYYRHILYKLYILYIFVLYYYYVRRLYNNSNYTVYIVLRTEERRTEER